MNNTREEGVTVEERPSLLDYVHLLLVWRRFILVTVGTVAVLTIIVSLLLPKWYLSTTSILPPSDQGSLNPLGAASSLLKGLTGGGTIGSFGQGLGSYNYFALLKSRTAMEEVIRKFDLMTVYDIRDSSVEDATKALQDNVEFEIQEDDYITISVYDTDPQRAADMANYFVSQLNRISIDLATREAKSNREFIQKRVEEVKAVLKTAEDSLRSYQESSRMIIPPDANSAALAPMAELYGLKARKEIELGIARRSGTGDNPMTKKLENELSEIQKKLRTFPEIGVTSLRLYHDIAIQQTILEFLVPMYEQAKVDEQKDVPVILVLDHAVPAKEKAKPKRMIIVGLATFTALIFSVFAIVIRERLVRLSKREAEGAKLRALRHVWRTTFPPRHRGKSPSGHDAA